jgi:plastocyanin
MPQTTNCPRPLIRLILIGVFLAGGAWGAVTEIDQVGQRFSLTRVSIGVGDALHFINHDDVRHNIRIIDADGQETDKGLQDPGQTIEAVFDHPGRFTARCAIHQKMKLAIDVK